MLIAIYHHLLVGFVMLQLEAKIQGITDKIVPIARPMAILALTLAVLTYVAEPVLPDFARENKGVVRRVLFALLAIGLIPDLITMIA